MEIDKKLKSGLRKCPLHKYADHFEKVKDNWFQCIKCKGYHFVDDLILKELNGRNIRISKVERGIHYII